MIYLIVVIGVVVLIVFWGWSRHLDRRTKRTTGRRAMIGRRAEVVEMCRPNGTVRLGSELWQARCDGGADPGQTVVVESVDDLLLVVRHPGD